MGIDVQSTEDHYARVTCDGWNCDNALKGSSHPHARAAHAPSIDLALEAKWMLFQATARRRMHHEEDPFTWLAICPKCQATALAPKRGKYGVG